MASVNRRVLPGFSLTLGYSVFYLSVLVVIPIAACFLKASTLSLDEFVRAVWTDRARAAYSLTFGAAFVAAAVNVALGLRGCWCVTNFR
jgi:sulfate transport system permease protein